MKTQYWIGKQRPIFYARTFKLMDEFNQWCKETKTECDLLSSGGNGYTVAIMNNEELFVLRWV